MGQTPPLKETELTLSVVSITLWTPLFSFRKMFSYYFNIRITHHKNSVILLHIEKDFYVFYHSFVVYMVDPPYIIISFYINYFWIFIITIQYIKTHLKHLLLRNINKEYPSKDFFLHLLYYYI